MRPRRWLQLSSSYRMNTAGTFSSLYSVFTQGHLLGLLPITLLKDLVLFQTGLLQTPNHQPTTFFVLDVCVNFSCHTRVPRGIMVIILILKELPYLQQDSFGIGMLFSPSMPAISTAAATGTQNEQNAVLYLTIQLYLFSVILPRSTLSWRAVMRSRVRLISVLQELCRKSTNGFR